MRTPSIHATEIENEREAKIDKKVYENCYWKDSAKC